VEQAVDDGGGGDLVTEDSTPLREDLLEVTMMLPLV